MTSAARRAREAAAKRRGWSLVLSSHEKGNLLVAAFCLVVAALVVWYFARPAARRIHCIAPIGPGEALFFEVAADDVDDAASVALMRADGERVWETDINPAGHFRRFGVCPAAADATRVYVLGVLGALGEEEQVLAFDRATGDVLWRSERPNIATSIRFDTTLLLDGEQLVITHGVPVPHEAPVRSSVTAFDARTGARLWPKTEAERLTGLANLKASVLSPGHLILSGLEGSATPDRVADNGLELDTRTGAVLRLLPIFWGHWPTPRGVLGLGLEGLYLFPAAPSAKEPPRLLVSASDYSFSGRAAPIGIFEDLVVVGLTPKVARTSAPGELVLVGVDLESGTPRWTVDLPPESEFVDSFSATGELPRILPIGTRPLDTPTPSHQAHTGTVTLVDLKTGMKVGEKQYSHLGPMVVTAARAVNFRPEPYPSDFIVFQRDGDGVLAAPALPKVLSIGDTSQFIQFNELWYFGVPHARPSGLPWGVIDIPTWTILHQNGDFDE